MLSLARNSRPPTLRIASMKSTTTLRQAAVATLAALGSSAVLAQAAAPAPPWTVTANIGLFSEYMFRGISQTGGKPAVQGGFDAGHASGFYLGTWASNVSWLQDFNAYSRSSLEWDFYGGYKANFGSSDFYWDLGTVYYYFPGSKNPGVVSADTWEIYLGLGWKWAGLRIYYNLDDYFGIRPTGQKTDGTLYYDGSITYPVGETGFSLLAHVGYLDVHKDGSGDGKAGYTDWRLGASYTVPDGVLKGLEIGAYYSDNNAKSPFYTDFTGYDTATPR
jgi:uncharacterized protein (TIGR02001 family)